MSKTKGSPDGSSAAGKKQSKRRAPRGENAVDKAIIAFEKKLDGNNVTLGEYLRLVQLQKETDADEPRDVEVTWKDQDETKSSGK